jgi:hypothetical protein
VGVGVPEGAGTFDDPVLFDPVLEEELGKFEVNVRFGLL